MPDLHLFTGDAAANTVRPALGIPNDGFLVQHDVISCGPLRSYASPGEWTRERTGFWLGMSRGESFGEFPNDLVEQSDRIRNAGRIVVWVGAGLSDRLLLPALVHLADIKGIQLPTIEVAEILSHPALTVPVLGWGMLRTKDVGRPKTRRLDTADLDEARRTWEVVTSTDPRAVPAYLEASDDSALVNAMSTLVERYPDETRGLSHWDASLLAAMPNSESSVFTVVGGAIGANHQHLDPVGDMYLFWRLRGMAEAKRPLVRLTGDSRITADSLRSTQVKPTDLGLAVREGRASFAAENGIDDWVGGVHLAAPAGSPWYRRNGELVSRGTT